MANPKWKTPRSKTRSRRAANWKLNAVTVVECSHCHQPKRAHFVCQNCGYHGGRLAVQPVDENASASR
ncbi:MAG TPA: 50S ribosomal protein L32 [Candidatus Dormibacteraeota bacterium]|nr:50S ribosomal protein L32 [Candidatus Dormibacteraeota bacterium]